MFESAVLLTTKRFIFDDRSKGLMKSFSRSVRQTSWHAAKGHHLVSAVFQARPYSGYSGASLTAYMFLPKRADCKIIAATHTVRWSILRDEGVTTAVLYK